MRPDRRGHPARDLIGPPSFPVIDPVDLLTDPGEEGLEEVRGGAALAQVAREAQAVERQQLLPDCRSRRSRLCREVSQPGAQRSPFPTRVRQGVKAHQFLQPPVSRSIRPFRDRAAQVAPLMQPAALAQAPLAKDLLEGFAQGRGPIHDRQYARTVQGKAPLRDRSQYVSHPLTVLRIACAYLQRHRDPVSRNASRRDPHAAPALSALDPQRDKRLSAQRPFIRSDPGLSRCPGPRPGTPTSATPPASACSRRALARSCGC